MHVGGRSWCLAGCRGHHACRHGHAVTGLQLQAAVSAAGQPTRERESPVVLEFHDDRGQPRLHPV